MDFVKRLKTIFILGSRFVLIKDYDLKGSTMGYNVALDKYYYY